MTDKRNELNLHHFFEFLNHHHFFLTDFTDNTDLDFHSSSTRDLGSLTLAGFRRSEHSENKETSVIFRINKKKQPLKKGGWVGDMRFRKCFGEVMNVMSGRGVEGSLW